MKILMISISSIHFFRWTEQLRTSGHEVYWIDVYDGNTPNNSIDFVHQITGWRNRVKYPGRYYLKKNHPRFHTLLNTVNQRKLIDLVAEKIVELQPDIVHSFVLQSGALPLINLMQRYPHIYWVYSAWGNDLHFRQKNDKDLEGIQHTLPHINYMFADCSRDYFIAQQNGFKGTYLGTFPTGGGYELEKYSPFLSDWTSRKTILIKGYQGILGRCNKVLEAISELKKELNNFDIVVFGANDLVKEAIGSLGLSHWYNFTVYEQLTHEQVLRLMGKSKIYIGNSISDGTPNTLLEAILMEVFPIQSNPGGATEELIADGINGLLLEYPEDEHAIAEQIKRALQDGKLLEQAVQHNTQHIKPYLEREYIKKQVLHAYEVIEKSLTPTKAC